MKKEIKSKISERNDIEIFCSPNKLDISIGVLHDCIDIQKEDISNLIKALKDVEKSLSNIDEDKSRYFMISYAWYSKEENCNGFGSTEVHVKNGSLNCNNIIKGLIKEQPMLDNILILNIIEFSKTEYHDWIK